MSTELLVLKIKSLLAERTGVAEERMTLETRLAEDLHMTGPKAAEFMRAFFAAFGIDDAQFSFARHFPAEQGAGGPIARLVHGWGRREPVTILDLVRAAETGMWLDSKPE
jgi:hypothetical protein